MTTENAVTKLTPHVSHYLLFSEVMQEIGIDCSLTKMMEQWDWFGLPFPFLAHQECVTMPSIHVRDTIVRVFENLRGTTVFYETLMALHILPEVTHWKDAHEEDEYANEYAVILTLATGERTQRDERTLLRELQMTFLEKWNALVEWNYAIDLDLTAIWKP